MLNPSVSSVGSIPLSAIQIAGLIKDLKVQLAAQEKAILTAPWFYKDGKVGNVKINKRRLSYGIEPGYAYQIRGHHTRNVGEWIETFAHQNPGVEITAKDLFDLSPYATWQRFRETFYNRANGAAFEPIGNGLYRAKKP